MSTRFGGRLATRPDIRLGVHDIKTPAPPRPLTWQIEAKLSFEILHCCSLHW